MIPAHGCRKTSACQLYDTAELSTSQGCLDTVTDSLCCLQMQSQCKTPTTPACMQVTPYDDERSHQAFQRTRLFSTQAGQQNNCMALTRACSWAFPDSPCSTSCANMLTHQHKRPDSVVLLTDRLIHL